MELTIFLANVIGWYFVIVSLVLLLRPQSMKTVMQDILAGKGLMGIIAVMTLILGLLLVVSHNVWVMGWPVIITIIAWLVLIGGIVRLFLPEQAVKVGQWWLRHPTSLIIVALICLIIGIYLLYRAHFA